MVIFYMSYLTEKDNFDFQYGRCNFAIKFPSTRKQQKELFCVYFNMNCGTKELTSNHTNLTLSNQISSCVDTTYKGLSLLMHVFGEAVV